VSWTSGYSYLRVVTIQINVHPTGETWPTCHTHLMLTPHMVPDHTYLTWSTHSNLSCSHQQSWAGSLLPRKKGSQYNPQHDDWPIHGFVPSFSPEPTNEAVGAKPTFCWWLATRLTEPIPLTCDRYVQYLLVGANPSVLNRHRWGLQPWRCQFSTYHSPTFPIDSLHFPPKGLSGLQLNHIPLIKPKLSLRNLWPSCSLSTTRSSNETYIYA
jgi:hypothetical protein